MAETPATITGPPQAETHPPGADARAGFTFRAVGMKGSVDYAQRSDANPYLTGIRKFLRMFRTGREPHTAAEILEPIAVLEALAKAIKAGKRVRVTKLPC